VRATTQRNGLSPTEPWQNRVSVLRSMIAIKTEKRKSLMAHYRFVRNFSFFVRGQIIFVDLVFRLQLLG
jgi:hypothetical protein